MLRKSGAATFTAGLCLVLLPAILPAQINTGRITGFVTDPTGAIVADVVLRAVNEETGVGTLSKSTGTGEYLVNFLVPGNYRLEAEHTGFQKSVQTGVIVNAGGITHVDFAMRVGELRQTVEVAANPLSVNTETSELSETFTHKQLDALPNIDRNPLYQMNLMPGANNGRGSGNYGNNGGEDGSAVGNSRNQLASIGGVNANANSVFIEGTFNREPQNAYVGVVPPIEGIAEVQVYTGKYNAEYGFSGSAVVNVVTKSGTNEHHGSLFEYLRNNATDATPFFSHSNTPFHRNQFGGAIGGPVLKNKLFFFADYQGTYFNTAGTSFTTAPTDKMYKGDFSELLDPTQKDSAGNPLGQLYDPFTRKFDSSGNVISATPFPGNIIPANRFDSVSAKMNADAIFGRANLPGTDNNLYYVSTVGRTVHQGDGRIDYNLSDKDRFFYRYSGMKSVLDNSTSINQFFQDGNADSDSYNQNMHLTNMHMFSPTKMNELRAAYNRTNVTTSAKSMSKPWNNIYGLPNGNLGDPVTQGLAEFGSLDPLHNVGDPDWVGFIISNTISLTENFTWVKGKHNMKFGTNLNWVEDTSADTAGGDSPRGTLFFDPAMTSYNGNALDYAYPSFLLGTPVQVTRARFVGGWPYQSYWQNAWYAQDDFKVTPSLTLNLGMRYELSTRPVERFNRQANWDVRTNQLVVATKDNRAPSMNLDTGDWGPRFGFAYTPDHGKTSIRGGYGISYWQAYWSGPLTILGLTYPFYAKSAFTAENNLIPSLQLSQVGIPVASAQYDANGKLVLPPDAIIRGVDYKWKNQRVDQGSFNIERQLKSGMLLDVGYVHVRGKNNNVGLNINQATPGPANQDFNLRRPLYGTYPYLGDIPIQYSLGNSYYDAITARFVANITSYLNVYATYAHGRNFADGNNIDQTNIQQYYGPTQQDIAHIFNSQVTFDSPLGRGKAFGGNMHPALDAIAGGWHYSAFIFVRSGTRFGVSSPVSLLHNGQGNRPDRIKDGNLPSSERTLQHWYDTTAFVNDLVDQTYGNAGTNPLFADGMQQVDSSIFKTFKILEKASVEFRADLFNTFNHPNFNPPSAKVGSGSNGQVTSTSTDPRRIQFGLRLFF
jgi:hypothetical protein